MDLSKTWKHETSNLITATMADPSRSLNMNSRIRGNATRVKTALGRRRGVEVQCDTTVPEKLRRCEKEDFLRVLFNF